MNTTTTPRARAGKPYVMPLHRAMPIDFVLPDEDAVRADLDRVMKMPIDKPQHVETASVDDTKDMKASEFAFWFWSRAMWTVCWFGLGILYARTFS